MRFPLFIPMILLDLFAVMNFISSLVVGPTWKFYLSLAGVIAFTIGSILTGGYLIRQGDGANHQQH